MSITKDKPKRHYVNNKELFAAMVVFKNDVDACKEAGKPLPRIPNYVGECIMKISTHLAYRPNFANYTYREDMISDGIENCLLYINNFDPASHRIHLLISRRSFTSRSSVAFRRKRSNYTQSMLLSGKLI
jgi:hypothetical protein